MDFFFLAFFATIGVYAAKTAEQRQRIALLGSFCRSRAVASARLMALHKTAYDQVLAAVSPETRRDYLDLVQA